MDGMPPGLEAEEAYWVFLTDEGWGNPEILRVLQAGGARIRTRSHFLKAVSVDAAPSAVLHFLDLPGVRELRPVARLAPLPSWVPPSRAGSTPSTSGAQTAALKGRQTSLKADSVYGALGSVLDILGLPTIHGLGFQGGGVRIGILDGLFLENHGAFQANPPIAVKDFVDGDDSVSPSMADPPGAADHGTGLWSLLSGNVPNVILGGAPEAGILLARIRGGEDFVTQTDEDRWVAGLEWLVSQGARIVVSGVGFRVFPLSQYTIEDLDGDRAPSTRAADEAARRGVLVVTPVGNSGSGAQTLEAPADGDSVLSAGAVTLAGEIASFSAMGPTGDGRDKPELLAPGEDVPVAVTQSLEPSPASGTEYAAALLAAGAALFVEAYPERGPLEILEAFQKAARPQERPFEGVPDVASAILFPEGIQALPLEGVGEGGQVTNLAPRFSWDAPLLHPLGLPVTFRLQLSEDSLAQSVLWTDSVVGTFGRRPSRPLPPRSTLYWRVEARSVQGVTRRSRVQGPLEIPSWVSLDVLNEPGGVQLSENRPEFQWTPLELPPPLGPFTYELQVVSDREGQPVQSYDGLAEEHFKLPEPLPFNEPFRWRVIAKTRQGSVDTTTSAGPFVVISGSVPPVTILFQNFPNPFPNPEVEGGMETRIWFDLARESDVELAVFDIRGRVVRSLIPAPGCGPVRLPGGVYGRTRGASGDPCTSYSWDGRDDRGRRMPPGVYLLRMKAGGVEQIRRMVLSR